MTRSTEPEATDGSADESAVEYCIVKTLKHCQIKIEGCDGTNDLTLTFLRSGADSYMAEERSVPITWLNNGDSWVVTVPCRGRTER